MCNTSLHHRAFSNAMDPFSFSTFHLLRTCNRLMLPNADTQSYYDILKDSNSVSIRSIDGSRGANSCLRGATLAPTPTPIKSPILDIIETNTTDELETTINTDIIKLSSNDGHRHDERPSSATTAALTPIESNGTSTIRNNGISTTTIPSFSVLPTAIASNGLLNNKTPLPAFEYIAPAAAAVNHAVNVNDFPLMELNRVGVYPAFLHRRSRGEKRPIPDEQKDEKYYERRKRNNEAAKKSRDARKIREDRIAFRAALLEQENSILRAQVMALRDELQTMRQLISTTSSAIP